MTESPSDLASRCKRHLTEYLSSPSEATLTGAYQWSRTALACGLGLLDVITIHRALRMEIIQESADIKSPSALEHAEMFFAESLAPFEMTHRSFQEANSELRTMNKELEEAIRSRDEFLTIASHELKTPMTPLNLNFQILKRAVEKNESPEAVRETIFKIVGNCTRSLSRLSRLIDELLSVSRIRTGQMILMPETLNLTQLVRGVAEPYRPEFERLGGRLDLHLEPPVWVKWDPLRTEEILVNLITNAIKFSAGSATEIRVFQEVDQAKIVVKDFGIGIAPEDQERIFLRFERAVSAKHFGGLGLGLYIVRQIVDAYGGEIKVESSLGRGATFTVRAPIVPPLAAKNVLENINPLPATHKSP